MVYMGNKCSRSSCVKICAVFIILIFGAGLAGCGEGRLTDAEYVQRAKALQDKGDLRASVIQLKNALQVNPDNPEARWLLGKLQLEAGNAPAAERDLIRAQSLGVAREAVRVPLLKAYLLQGKYTQVLAETANPTGWSANDLAILHALRGYAYLGQGTLAQAAQEFDLALQERGSLTYAQLGKARLVYAEGRSDAARRLVDLALKDAPDSGEAWGLSGDLYMAQARLDKADEAYTKAIEFSFNNGGYLLSRALIRIANKDYVTAKSDLQVLKKTSSFDPGVFYAEGLISFLQHRYADAQGAFEEALTRNPNYMPAVFYLGVTHYLQNHLEQATQYLGRYHARFPNFDDASKFLGLALIRRRHFNEAAVVLKPVLARTPNDSLVLTLLGNIAMAQGDTRAAIQYLSRVAHDQPASAVNRFTLGVGLLVGGQRAHAIKELQTAVNLEPGLQQAELLLILSRLDAKQYDKAAEISARWTEKQPDNADAFNVLGVVQSVRGDDGRARAAFERALELSPGDPSITHNLAALELKAGRVEKAKSLYERVLDQRPGELQTSLALAALEAREGRTERAQQLLVKASGVHPKALAPRLALAHYYLGNNRPAQAVTVLRDVVDLYRNNPDLLLELGTAQLAAGDVSHALPTLRRLVAAKPRSAEAHYLLAKAYGLSDRPADMKAELKAALAREPAHFRANIAMGRLLLLEQKPDQAAKVIVRLTQQRPHDPEVLDLKGMLALRQSKPGQAVAAYREAVKVSPVGELAVKLAKAQWAAGNRDGSLATLQDWVGKHPGDVLVRYQLATLYLAMKRTQEARTAFEDVVKRQPSNVGALNNLAWLLRDTAPATARKYAEHAYKLASANPAVMDTLGVILLDQGQLDRSLSLLRGAAEKTPADPSINYHLALALERNGARAEARTMLKRALGGRKDFAEREQALSLARKLGVP